MGIFLIGVTGRCDGPLLPEDLEILCLAQVQALKTSFVEAPPDVLTILQAPSNDDWADTIRRAYDLGVRHFIIHDEPNTANSGWREYWTNGVGFSRWWIEIWAEAKSKWPDAKWGFPAMRPGEDVGTLIADSEKFFEECQEAIDCADFYELYAWWKNPEQMKQALWRIDWHQRLWPEKELCVTFANQNSTVSKRQKAEEYLEFYARLRERKHIFAGFSFCLSSSDPLHKFVSWRTEIRKKTPCIIPRIIGSREI